MSVSVVIPAKNEARTIGEVLGSLRELDFVSEVIVVNDGSTDNTKEVCECYGINVITHPYSKGNGAAIKAGARAATGDVIVFMDGDGQHSPNHIPDLLKKIDDGYDLVVGARSKSSQASTGRWLANTLYNKMASWMVDHPVLDLTSGFRAVRAKLFKRFLYLLPNGFSYPTTSTMAFFRAGHSVTYIPINVAKREGDSHIRPIKDGLRFVLIMFKICTLYSPFKLFLPVSFSFFLVGCLYYLYTYAVDGRFTNMSMLLFMTAVLSFLMGLLSEQITTLNYKGTDRDHERSTD